MNILYLCHRIPFPPDKGDKIRSFHQIRLLGSAHDVHVACLVDDPLDREHVASLRSYCRSVDAPYQSRAVGKVKALLALAGGTPLSVAAFDSPSLRRAIKERIRSGWPDAIIVFSSAMASYVPPDCSIPLLIDFVDADSDKWRLYAERSSVATRWIYRIEADRLGRFEREAAARADRSLFVSDKEAQLLGLTPGDGRTFVLTLGVDTDYFHPRNAAPAAAPRAVFVGMMDYYPNIDAVTWFAPAVHPLVRARVPAAAFDIVGRNPGPGVRALGDLPGVRVTGPVPDVRPYLGRGAVAVAPFRIARGIQSKVLEAMAMELPIVGTPNAFQGLHTTAADGIASIDSAAGLADELVALYGDAAERERRGRQARAYVQARHRWEAHDRELDSILAGMMGERAAASSTTAEPRS